MNNRDINRMYFSFIGKLVMLTLFVVITFIAIIYLFPDVVLPSRSVSVFIVLFGVTAGVHYILLRAGRGDSQKLANFIILAIVIKLFLYAVFTFLLIFSDRPGAMSNVVLFFVVYIIFTVFEITTMYYQMNQINQK